MNVFSLIGNLTANPDLKYLPNGTAVCEFSIAWNEVYYKGEGREKQEKVHFINCQAWAGMAENIAKYFKKGQKMGVTGGLRQDRWEKDGQKHSKVFVRVESFDFCEGRKEGEPKDWDEAKEQAQKREASAKKASPSDPDLDPLPSGNSSDLPYD